MGAKDQKKRSTAWHPATELVHAGTLRSQFGETSEAIFLNSGYVYASAEQAEARFKGDEEGFVYSRYANPTVAMFEARMCALEGADAARGTASGMAAVAASLLCHLKAGDHVVSARALFGSCRYIVEDLLPRYGIATTLVDGRDLGAWEAAMRPNTRVVFFETPTNPVLELVDIEAVAKIAHKAGALVVVDNVFATPLLQRPMPLGADIVVYSATKHIDGQGRCLGGVVLGGKEFIEEKLHNYLSTPAPRSARSMPGCCSRGSRRCPCGLSGTGHQPRRSPISWLSVPRSPASSIRAAPTTRSMLLPSGRWRVAAPWSPSRSRATRPPRSAA